MMWKLSYYTKDLLSTTYNTIKYVSYSFHIDTLAHTHKCIDTYTKTRTNRHIHIDFGHIHIDTLTHRHIDTLT